MSGPLERSKGVWASSCASWRACASRSAGGQFCQVGDGQAQFELPGDDLHGGAIQRGEAGAQGFVAAHDFVQGAAQCRFVQFADQAHGTGDVVQRAAGFELVQEPQALLGKRG